MKPADVDFSRLAVAHGWISSGACERSLEDADQYQALGLDKSVAEVLVEGGHLTQEQVRLLREELGWTLKRPRIGDYEVLRRIGLGGMGTVYEARHVRLKQRIALKILLPRHAREPQMAERFLLEARTLAKLNHPHLVHAVDAGKDGEYYYLAMEYVEGENLLQVIARDGRLDPLKSIEIVRSICEALSALQEKGLVHRDVKPANVLIGQDGTVKLADLGLLKVVDDVLVPKERFICGTPHYISPEQVQRREDIDVRSDLYSLGATWYHMLVGRPPFIGRTSGEILRAHLERDPPPPSHLRGTIPLPLERTIIRWLSKSREERPQSPDKALEDLRRLSMSLRSRTETIRRVAARLLGVPKGWARPTARRRIALVALLVALGVLGYLALRGCGSRGSLVAPSMSPLSVADRISGTSGETGPATSADATSGMVARTEAPAAAAEASRKAPVIPGTDTKDAGPKEPMPESPAANDSVTKKTAPEEPASEQALESGGETPIIARARGLAFRGLSAVQERLEDLHLLLEPAAADFEPLARLGESFHAASVAVEPRREGPSVILRYEFASSDEILDFRGPPGAWSIKGGLCSSSDASGDSLDTVAWFSAPVCIEGELASEARLVLGWGTLRVAPGHASDARIWDGGAAGDPSGASPPPAVAIPPVPAGSFRVVFSQAGVEIQSSGNTAVKRALAPGSGRLVLQLGRGGCLSRLGVEARLEPEWARERARALMR